MILPPKDVPDPWPQPGPQPGPFCTKETMDYAAVLKDAMRDLEKLLAAKKLVPVLIIAETHAHPHGPAVLGPHGLSLTGVSGRLQQARALLDYRMAQCADAFERATASMEGSRGVSIF